MKSRITSKVIKPYLHSGIHFRSRSPDYENNSKIKNYDKKQPSLNFTGATRPKVAKPDFAEHEIKINRETCEFPPVEAMDRFQNSPQTIFFFISVSIKKFLFHDLSLKGWFHLPMNGQWNGMVTGLQMAQSKQCVKEWTACDYLRMGNPLRKNYPRNMFSTNFFLQRGEGGRK